VVSSGPEKNPHKIWRTKMVDRIAQHRHCKNCEKAIPYGEKFCDDNCEKEWKSAMQAKKRQLLYFYGLMVVMFLVAMMLVFIR